MGGNVVHENSFCCLFMLIDSFILKETLYRSSELHQY